METLAERINRLRATRHMSQRALAERIGVTHASVIRIENGEHKPRADSLHPMARALGVSTDYLLTGRDAPQHAALISAIRQRMPYERLVAMVRDE